MIKIFASLCLVLACFAAEAGAQFYTSETARKAGEKMEWGDRAGALAVLDEGLLLVLQGKDAEAEEGFALHAQMFRISRESLNKRIEEARKLRAQPPPQ